MMNNPIHFTDEHFDPQSSGNCHLFIHLNIDSYSYAIVDKKQNRLSALHQKHFPMGIGDFSTSNQFENLRAENENLNLQFEKVKISLETRAFTFVPAELFLADDLPNYSKFMGAMPGTALLNADISQADLKNIFAVEPNLVDKLRSVFPDPLIVSQANQFIAGVYSVLEKGGQSELFLNFNRHSFEASVVRNGSLAFYNVFDFSDADEFNYFLLNLINQLNINRSQAIIVSGEIERKDELYARLQKYFDYISFAEAGITSGKAEPVHQFFSLLSLDLCE